MHFFVERRLKQELGACRTYKHESSRCRLLGLSNQKLGAAIITGWRGGTGEVNENISNEITRETGATTKPRNSVRASLSKNVDQTKFGSLANAFAIIFVEVFEVGTLAACDWEIIETALECIVAAKHVRDFELLDWVQEEEARKAREAEALKEKENAEKAEQKKLKQQRIMRLQEIREAKKQCERDEAKLVATCRESSSSHYVDGAPKPADLFRGDTPEMKKPKNDIMPSSNPDMKYLQEEKVDERKMVQTWRNWIVWKMSQRDGSKNSS